jgi:hypothetical protein
VGQTVDFVLAGSEPDESSAAMRSEREGSERTRVRGTLDTAAKGPAAE